MSPTTLCLYMSYHETTEVRRTVKKQNLKILSKAHPYLQSDICIYGCFIKKCIKLLEYLHSKGTTFIKLTS